MNYLSALRKIYRRVSVTFGGASVFYVSSVTGSSSNDGLSPETPMATIAQALALCTADKGDTIVLMAGHTETYSTTGSKWTSVAGVRIVSAGRGADRGTMTFSHTGATLTLSAAGFTLENVLFVTGVDSVVTFATIAGADVSLLNCETRDTTDKEVIDAFIITGARFTARGHLHNGYTSGDANARVFKLNGVARALIEDCRFITKVTTAVINFVTTACTGVVIRDCTFNVASTTDFSKNVVDTITGSTWIVERGYDVGAGVSFGGGSGSALAAITGTGLTSTGIGTLFSVPCTVTSSAIPNNTQTSGAFTGAASGTIIVEDIILETGSTGVAGAGITNVNFTTDNAKGLTGASAPVCAEALTALGANKTISMKAEGTTKHLPFTLEDTKKLYISGDAAAGTGAGTVRITLVCRRGSLAASLAAGGIGS